jgi:hypothetical protein
MEDKNMEYENHKNIMKPIMKKYPQVAERSDKCFPLYWYVGKAKTVYPTKSGFTAYYKNKKLAAIKTGAEIEAFMLADYGAELGTAPPTTPVKKTKHAVAPHSEKVEKPVVKDMLGGSVKQIHYAPVSGILNASELSREVLGKAIHIGEWPFRNAARTYDSNAELKRLGVKFVVLTKAQYEQRLNEYRAWKRAWENGVTTTPPKSKMTVTPQNDTAREISEIKTELSALLNRLNQL